VTLDPAFVDDAVVAADDVSKWFGQKVAVSNVSMSFGPGVTGLLGPNGAGKTTLLRMLSGLISPSKGTVSIDGRPPRTDHTVHNDVALVPEESGVYGFMTGREYVGYAATLTRTPSPAAAVERVIDLVEMQESADRAVGGYSKGMRQRIKVAAALVHDPNVLILDEPLNGTDPVQRAHLIALFRRLGTDGRTVIVSSHVLEEVERMTDRVVAMVDGKLAAAGDFTAIRSAMTDIPYHVLIRASDVRALASQLLTIDHIDGATVDSDTARIATRDVIALGRELPRIAQQLDVRVTEYRPEDESLESVFRYLVGKR
jgi:ABC-2 type transport system ATP-binding protein